MRDKTLHGSIRWLGIGQPLRSGERHMNKREVALVSLALMTATGLSKALASDFVPIDFPGAIYTQAEGINNVGQIVGLFGDAKGFHGFIETGGSFAQFDVTSAPNTTFAQDINDSGVVVSSVGPSGFTYSAGTVSTFDMPGAVRTIGRGINNEGQIA